MLTPMLVGGPHPVMIPTLPFIFPPPAFDSTRSCNFSIAAFLVEAACFAVTLMLISLGWVGFCSIKGGGGGDGEEGNGGIGGSSSKASWLVDCLRGYRMVIWREGNRADREIGGADKRGFRKKNM
jgi:hypothetical protein